MSESDYTTRTPPTSRKGEGMANDVVTLTDEERRRFVAWLAQQMSSIELIKLMGLAIVHQMLQSFDAIKRGG